MASAVIHLCVAKKIHNYLQNDERIFSLGAIAPDIAKQVGLSKNRSHFLDEDENEETPPHYEKFIKKYKSELEKPFELGYLVHLMTDFYWFKDYIPKMIDDYSDDKYANYTALRNIIYNDYTSLNQDLIDAYMLDLYYFQNEIEYPKSVIEEIPVDKLNILVDKMGLMIKQMNKRKLLIMDEKEIIAFIETCSNKIIEDLIKLKIIEDKYER